VCEYINICGSYLLFLFIFTYTCLYVTVHVNIGNLTSLVLRNNRISDVSPLRKCFSLESLVCSIV
jgi:Leucine-rich repeat (LRR) protein